jgi:hypothetical protein
MNNINLSDHRLKKYFLMAFLFMPVLTHGQDTIPRNWSVNGYITNMQSFMFQQWNGDWISDNLIHNRLNFKWYNIINNLNATVELRNRFISGQSVQIVPNYAGLVDQNNGYLNLSGNVAKGKSYLFNVSVDRLYLDYTLGKVQVTAGRQRINWGQCVVWNPNDLFNTYSFFDFDYIEKPGCDAVRLQYYPTTTSTFEMAAKLDSAGKVTAAALYRFNKWSYDIQILGGLYNQEDYMIGAGWSGNLLKAAFRGEVSYFRPRTNFADTTGTLVFSLGADYTFSNSLMLQAEVLYNQLKGSGNAGFINLYNMQLSAKRLSFTELSLLLQGSYPITPLFNVTLAGMFFPKIHGFFIGPSFSYSLTENVELALYEQSFGGQLQGNRTDYYHLIFLRLKWNF